MLKLKHVVVLIVLHLKYFDFFLSLYKELSELTFSACFIVLYNLLEDFRFLNVLVDKHFEDQVFVVLICLQETINVFS